MGESFLGCYELRHYTLCTLDDSLLGLAVRRHVHSAQLSDEYQIACPKRWQGKLPTASKVRMACQLGILYFLLFLLLLISMYSCSATLQDYVSRETYHLTGKWLEEYIDR